MKEFVNEHICQKCGGQCCKRMPGSTSPKDWGAPDRRLMRKNLIEALKGLYCIDWWIGDPRKNKNEIDDGYYVRPSTKGNEDKITHALWASTDECTFLSETGCELEPEKRPIDCRVLKPQENFE